MMNLFQKLVVLILGISWMTHGTDGLRCYKCLALDCPEKIEFCNHVKSFVLGEIRSVYYNYESNVPLCPNPTGENSEANWLEVQHSSRASCGEENSGEATCVLGRFRVITVPHDINKNITSHGTVTGCAKRKLLTYIKTATLKQKCSMVVASKRSLSMQHFLEVEHCSTRSEMCTEDWCVPLDQTIVKPFLSSKTESDRSSILFYSGLATVVVIGAVVALCTLLGMKYDTVRLRNQK